jgi:hypothetical protein
MLNGSELALMLTHPGLPSRLYLLVSPLTVALWLFAGPAGASPFGTSYTASATNFPGTDTAVLEFDGLEETLGSSGLVVGETSTTFVDFELIEFSLRTGDGNPFVGQQVAPLDVASLLASDLRWFGDPTPVGALADSAFLWLAIDGEAQALSDFADLGLLFGTHPLNSSIPVWLIDNPATVEFGFDTFGESVSVAFAALVGPTLAAQIDEVHFGVAAAPIPEPGTGLLLLCGLVLCCGARSRGAGR